MNNIQPFCNISYLNSTNIEPPFADLNPTKETHCKVGMVLAPGHGYLSFDCPSINVEGDYGFYPRHGVEPNAPSQIITSGKNAAYIDLTSGFTSGFTTGRIENLQIAQKLSIVISPQCSLASIGTTRTAFDCAVQNVPPSGAVNVAISAVKSGDLGKSDHSKPGMISNELFQISHYLCKSDPDNCIKFSLPTDPSKAKKLFDFVNENKKTPPEFRLLTNNCINFAVKALRHIGEFDTIRKEMLDQIANKPLYSRITSLAWQYFSWTQ